MTRLTVIRHTSVVVHASVAAALTAKGGQRINEILALCGGAVVMVPPHPAGASDVTVTVDAKSDRSLSAAVAEVLAIPAVHTTVLLPPSTAKHLGRQFVALMVPAMPAGCSVEWVNAKEAIQLSGPSADVVEAGVAIVAEGRWVVCACTLAQGVVDNLRANKNALLRELEGTHSCTTHLHIHSGQWCVSVLSRTQAGFGSLVTALNTVSAEVSRTAQVHVIVLDPFTTRYHQSELTAIAAGHR